MSEISKIYGQFQENLMLSQGEYEERIKKYADAVKSRHDEILKYHIKSFSEEFSDQISRIDLKGMAESFFQTADIRFVAIDASCHKEQSSEFLSFYGGAYGSKGIAKLSSGEGKIEYERWEMNKDVSMVAFMPIPPDVIQDSALMEENDVFLNYSDREISEISSMHTKVMQLAEIYLAYSQASNGGMDAPNLILIDNSLSGILGNTSFSPRGLRIRDGDFSGESLTFSDLTIANAHPFSVELNVPSLKRFNPEFRLIAEADWKEKREISKSDISYFKHFDDATRILEKAGVGKTAGDTFKFTVDPRSSWKKTVRIYEDICERLFVKKDPTAITYRIKGTDNKEFMTARDVQFLVGVGIRALIERCWDKKILLVGIVKDSSSRFWYKNYLGTINFMAGGDMNTHLRIPLSDRSIAEILPNVVEDLKAPWSTIEFDSSFMTLHTENDKKQESDPDNWVVKGYNTPNGMDVTRPEGIFLRSLIQFFQTPDKGLSSHALFVDRLAYPGWDNKDSKDFELATPFGKVKPLQFDLEGDARMHKLMVYILSVLVKNHYPEALGYPDPLHQADWGAKSLKHRVMGLLQSSSWMFRAKPLSKTFRSIRESYRR